jgi:hypothetical protein
MTSAPKTAAAAQAAPADQGWSNEFDDEEWDFVFGFMFAESDDESDEPVPGSFVPSKGRAG